MVLGHPRMIHKRWDGEVRIQQASSFMLPAPVGAVWPALCVQEQVCYLRWGAGQGERSVNSEWNTLGSGFPWDGYKQVVELESVLSGL